MYRLRAAGIPRKHHREAQMTFQRILGLVLVVFGAIALAYQGVTYSYRKKVIDIGPIQATKKEQKTIPLPPILGGAALLGGIGLIVDSQGSRG